MRQQVRSAFLAAPALLAIALTAAVSACGSTAAPQSGLSAGGSSAASSAGTPGASGQAIGTSTAAVPPAARRVQCPESMTPLVHLPDSAKGGGPVQPDGPVRAAEPIPAGFRPVAVVECVTVSSVNHGLVRIDQRRQAAVAGLGPLLAALRKPSAPRPEGALPACPVPAYSWPWFVLVSATGQVIRPVVPVGVCEQPIEPVLASLNSLRWITLGTVAFPVGPERPLHGGPLPDITPAITVAN